MAFATVTVLSNAPNGPIMFDSVITAQTIKPDSCKILFATVISTVVPKISSVALCNSTLVSSVMLITSLDAKSALALLLVIVAFAIKCIVSDVSHNRG